MAWRAFLTACFFGLLAGPALAQSGFYLPVAPTSYGQDEFRAADGTTCRSSMDGTKRVEVGAFGSGGRTDNNGYTLPGYTNPNQGNAGVYGRLSVSLDAPSERMNCNTLYKLELERRQLELELMKRSLVEADRRLDDLKQSRADDPADAPVRAAGAGGKPVTKTAQKPASKAVAKPAKLAATKGQGGYPPP